VVQFSFVIVARRTGGDFRIYQPWYNLGQPLRLTAIRAATISKAVTPNNTEWILGAISRTSGGKPFTQQQRPYLGQWADSKSGGLRSLADQTPDGRVRRIAEEAMQKVRNASV
jgi:aminopeptidase N